MKIVITRSGMAYLNTLRLAALPMDENFELRLFQNDVVPTLESVFDDFTNADFTGYAEVPGPTATPNPTLVTPLGEGAEVPPHAVFTATGNTVTNTVYGWFMVNVSTGQNLVCARRFDTPKTFLQAGDVAIVEWPLIWGQPQTEYQE